MYPHLLATFTTSRTLPKYSHRFCSSSESRTRSELFKISEISPNSLGIETDLDKLLTVDTKEDYQRFMSIKYKIDLDNTIDMSVLYKLMLSKY